MQFNLPIKRERDLLAVKDFPFNHISENQNSPTFLAFKTIKMTKMLKYAFEKTKKELANYFTFNEACVIISAFTSFCYSPHPEINDNDYLQTQIADVCRYEDAHILYGASQEQLMEKLAKLTEFQAFTVTFMAYEVLYCKNKIPFEDSIIKEVFNISECS
ncbi:hypothetical protein M4D70_15660 [Brevibacillus borstelensis]|uniref:hypothetical protein n=1 Tax=Brevibacillus borstelensis TaxID=45462 RepID=UPI00203E854F|nr:hypothetical protein [Brevibacillus borstelensis]MCM3623670.1 hypothetical protein [Brevibacillus borstelensis]